MKAALRELLERLNESIGLLEIEVDFYTRPMFSEQVKAVRLRFDELKWAMGREQL